MKLTELTPRWITLSHWCSDDPFYIGVSFECPHCKQSRIAVLFRNPIDPNGLINKILWTPPTPAWERTGDTFDNLSLSPSIDVIKYGHWHGFITVRNGVSEVTNS